MYGELVSDQSRSGQSNSAIMLGLLEAIAKDSAWSQRGLASEIGVALGLVNLYVRRCVKKGLIKVADVPSRRYAYYLTPKGFSEKAKLASDFMRESFSFYRRAKEGYKTTLDKMQRAGLKSVVLLGRSECAEVAILCALDVGLRVVAVVDPGGGQSLAGIRVFREFDDLPEAFDAVLISDIDSSDLAYSRACERFGEKRVYAPHFLACDSERDTHSQ